MRSWGWDTKLMWLVSLWEEEGPPRVCVYRGKAAWGRSEKAAIYQLEREASGECIPADTWIVDVKPPELWESKFLLFKPPSPWYFAVAALADTSPQRERVGWRHFTLNSPDCKLPEGRCYFSSPASNSVPDAWQVFSKYLLSEKIHGCKGWGQKMETLDLPCGQLRCCPIGPEKPLGVSEWGDAQNVVLGKILE